MKQESMGMSMKEMMVWSSFATILAVISMLCLASGAQENTPDSWYQKGLKLMEDDTYEDALIAFNKAIEMDPENASIWMGKGDTLVRMGDYNESQKIYEKSLEMADKTTRANPQDAKGWFVQGELLQKQSKYDEAIKAFDKAIEADPKYAEAWYRKGAVLYFGAWVQPKQDIVKTLEESLEALNKAIELNPEYGVAWSEKGYVLSSLADPNIDHVLSSPANLNAGLERYNESLEAFDRAIELIPAEESKNSLALAWDGKALALVGMGNILKDMKRQEEASERYDEAVNACDKAIELDPNFTGLEARLIKAGILSELGRYNESLATYDEAIKSMPADYAIFNASIMADKGGVLIKIGEYKEALTTIDAALQIDPTNPIAWENKGDALNGTGRYDEAINAYDRAIELSPELGTLKADSWQSKGDALLASGRQTEAAAAFSTAKELGYKE
jgi:tetratricopeptide (TPR) repeat protein